MDLDNKILKYKLKKKKLTNKINELIEKKKKEKKETITKIFHKTHEFSDIINEFIIGDLNNLEDLKNKKNLYIIVCGFVSVGKSTFIEYLENYFGDLYTKSKINIKNENELNILNNFVDNDEKKIVYIETNHILFEEIIKKIINNKKSISNNTSDNDYEIEIPKNIHIFYIIPTNLKLYKNRLINKILNLLKLIDSNIYDIDKSKYFINLIKKIASEILPDNILPDNILPNFLNNLNNKYPLTDDDFNFLDSYIEQSYNYIIDYQSNNEKIKKNISKCYF